MTSQLSLNFSKNKKFQVLKFGFKVVSEIFYCHIRVKDLHLFILFKKNHRNFKYEP